MGVLKKPPKQSPINIVGLFCDGLTRSIFGDWERVDERRRQIERWERHCFYITLTLGFYYYTLDSLHLLLYYSYKSQYWFKHQDANESCPPFTLTCSCLAGPRPLPKGENHQFTTHREFLFFHNILFFPYHTRCVMPIINSGRHYKAFRAVDFSQPKCIFPWQLLVPIFQYYW